MEFGGIRRGVSALDFQTLVIEGMSEAFRPFLGA